MLHFKQGANLFNTPVYGLLENQILFICITRQANRIGLDGEGGQFGVGKECFQERSIVAGKDADLVLGRYIERSSASNGSQSLVQGVVLPDGSVPDFIQRLQTPGRICICFYGPSIAQVWLSCFCCCGLGPSAAACAHIYSTARGDNYLTARHAH